MRLLEAYLAFLQVIGGVVLVYLSWEERSIYLLLIGLWCFIDVRLHVSR